MNNKIIGFIKNFSYTLSSNLIYILISSLAILIIPKKIGINDYGYWQLYIFYTSYIGFFHFGWIDGIYLRYGGKEYYDLDKPLFFSQFWSIFTIQFFIGICICIMTYFYVIDEDKKFIFSMMAICCLVVIPRTMLSYILQLTNRIKEYSGIIIIDRIIYFILIIILLSIGVRGYKIIIIVDIVAKGIALIYSICCCKEIVFRKISDFGINIKEICENISVGIKLMIANLSSMLIIGIVRFAIENTWSVETFGKVSLIISISNMMMIFINALGIIMFPMLRRINSEILPEIYSILRTIFDIIMLGVLVIYYPINNLISLWLPKYSDGLTYMILIFPIFIYEGKMALLINTYLKTMRKEKNMLFVNIISVFFSIMTTGIIILWKRNLTLGILSIVVLLAFRSVIAEIELSRTLKIKVTKDIILEIIMTILFINLGWFFNSIIGIIIYIIAYSIYLIIKKEDIIIILNKIKNIHNYQRQ